MPSTVLITSSTCCVINDSTSSGAAPGSPTRTETVGRSTAGKRSTPSRKKPAAPTTTSDKTIIVAKTGRRTQISARFCIGLGPWSWVVGLWVEVLGLRVEFEQRTKYKDLRPKTKSQKPLLNYFDSLARLQVARIHYDFLANVDPGDDLRKFRITASSSYRLFDRFPVLNDDHLLDSRKRNDR